MLVAAAALGCDDGTSDADPPVADQGVADASVDASPDPDVAVDAAPPEDPYTANVELPAEPFNYAEPEIPEHYTVETLGFHAQGPVVEDDTTPLFNQISDDGATLGRVLFYDTNLSQNRTIACASCHKAEFGFGDDRALSKGFLGGDTGRHSMGLTNARYYRVARFFWDQRAETLEDQVLMPFQDPVEMGMTLGSLVARVEAGDYYPALFEAAFGDSEVSPERISAALAQFVRTLISTTSKYDEGRAMVASRADPFPNFTDEENLGKTLFVSPPHDQGLGCFVCHSGEGFIPIEPTNNGLDADNADDLGYGGVTENPRDAGKFKVPSLRNVGLRAPYMHDGRFATLEEVVDHYSDGIKANPSLGAPFFARNGQVAQMNLSAERKAALVAFLHTLTDLEMVQDPKFADPFIRE